MGAYSSFNVEIAPFIIIHDKLDGVYILHFFQKTKTPVIAHRNNCKRKKHEQPDSELEEEDSSAQSEQDEEGETDLFKSTALSNKLKPVS